jgi:pyridoxine 4-dehydrogenase
MAQPTATASGQFAIGGELSVNRLGFGALWVTGPDVWGEPKDRPAALDLLREVAKLGVNLIDTADSYGPHTGEQAIHDALAPYRDGVVIATKGGYARPNPYAWIPLGRPE